MPTNKNNNKVIRVGGCQHLTSGKQSGAFFFKTIIFASSRDRITVELLIEYITKEERSASIEVFTCQKKRVKEVG